MPSSMATTSAVTATTFTVVMVVLMAVIVAMATAATVIMVVIVVMAVLTVNVAMSQLFFGSFADSNHFNVEGATVIAPMPALRAPRLRVQANDKTVVFHHCNGGIFSAPGGF